MTVDNAQREQDQGGRDEEASQRGRCRNGGGTTNEIVTDETRQLSILRPLKRSKTSIWALRLDQEFLSRISDWHDCCWSKLFIRSVHHQRTNKSNSDRRNQAVVDFKASKTLQNIDLGRLDQEFLSRISDWHDCCWSKLFIRSVHQH
jgi:hypothetical protein